MVPFVFAVILSVSFAEQPSPRGSQSDRVIRVYQQVLQLQQAVSRLLEGSGISLAFVDCENQPECNEWLRPDELVLRLMDGLDPTDSRTCGMAFQGTPRTPGILMSVYRGCVTSTSKHLRQLAFNRKASTVVLDLTEADMLAPIVIHEVVHLLLPAEAHGGSGIWKAVLNSEDWEHVGQGKLRLSAALRTRLRAAFSARAPGRAVHGSETRTHV